MLFHWTYEPNGPLFVRLWVAEDGYVTLDTFVKYYDMRYQHNFFLALKDDLLTEQEKRADRCMCPRCDVPLFMRPEDKYNVLVCNTCMFEAWSHKLYDPDDFYDYDDEGWYGDY